MAKDGRSFRGPGVARDVSSKRIVSAGNSLAWCFFERPAIKPLEIIFLMQTRGMA
jgi:hypothetical protein